MTTQDTNQNQHRDIGDIFWEEKTVFFLVFMGVLTVTYGVLFVLDFLPEKPQTDDTVRHVAEFSQEIPVITDVSADARIDSINERTAPAVSIIETEETERSAPVVDATPVDTPTVSEAAYAALPVRIIFDTLDNKQVTVLNPESTSITALDTALLSGVVRHPDSADFTETGTIFLFGHSSYLPNVVNKNFQAFNGIQKLTWGDKVRLHSETMEYVYRVDRVYEAKASSADVPITYGESKLTLATCNSFGSKDDRYIVEATLIETRALNS